MSWTFKGNILKYDERFSCFLIQEINPLKINSLKNKFLIETINNQGDVPDIVFPRIIDGEPYTLWLFIKDTQDTYEKKIEQAVLNLELNYEPYLELSNINVYKEVIVGTFDSARRMLEKYPELKEGFFCYI